MKALVYTSILLIISCSIKQVIKNNYDTTMVLYTDSTYAKAKDSLYITENDTLFSKKPFPITGYFKISDSNKTTYFQGYLNNNTKTGEWIFLQKRLKWQISEINNYNNMGLLEGKYTIYNLETGNPLSIHYYFNGNEAGLQQDFYPSGNLNITYETDSSGAFINKYIVYSENKNIIYETDLGNTGTGYIKFYNKDNQIEWEGSFKNKQKQGLHKSYLLSYDNKILEEESIYYKNNEIINQSKKSLQE